MQNITSLITFCNGTPDVQNLRTIDMIFHNIPKFNNQIHLCRRLIEVHVDLRLVKNVHMLLESDIYYVKVELICSTCYHIFRMTSVMIRY